MRFHHVPLLSCLLGCAAIVALAAAAYSCGGYGVEEVLAKDAKLPGSMQTSVVQGNHLIALLTDRRLVRVELTTGETKLLATLDAPAPLLDAAGASACVASKNRAMIVNLADGKTTRIAELDHDVGSLGFLTPQRVFVQSGPQIKVIDLAGKSPKLIHELSLGKADLKDSALGYRVLGRSGKHLYVSVAHEKHAVAVVDLEKGEVADRFSAAEFRVNSSRTAFNAYHFTGDKAFVLGSRLGYGVWVETLGVVDLKTRQYTAFKVPHRAIQGPTLVAGPRHTVFLTSLNGTYQFDTAGNLVAAISQGDGNVARDFEGILLGMWQGKPLMLDRDRLRQLPMSPAATAQATK